MSLRARQPLLHDLVTCLSAPAVALSAASGQIRPTGAEGVYVADLRVLSRAELQVLGSPLEPVSHTRFDAATAEFVAVLRGLGDPIPDPTVWLCRRRTVRTDGLTELVTVTNVTDRAQPVELRMTFEGDLAELEGVKVGRPTEPIAPEPVPGGARLVGPETTVVLAAEAAAISVDGATITARWLLTVPARGEAAASWSVSVTDCGAAVAPVADRLAVLSEVSVRAVDPRLEPLVRTGLDDLRALLMTPAGDPAAPFTAAGSPWYLTLFGRDSLWAARMSLPLGTELAGGTLRALAALQGTELDPHTAQEPGKIPHEVRRANSALADRFLPPVYYGTVDATALWLCLLGEAFRWGLPESQVADLMPAARRALDWLADSGDPDGDGFLEYLDASGRGLANQGWKDSGDSVRFADGRIADGPVALAEVQGYAYQAAMTGAELLEAFGFDGAPRWRDYAAALAGRFRERFWTSDELGRYPALALDGHKRLVDAPASNMGHLLGTGILNAREALEVADRLVHPSMSSGFGLRTMSTTAGGYSPLSYHCGSVWPHDTAIAVLGMLAEGLPGQAGVLIEGLLAAGHAFDSRVPELFGGFARDQFPTPVPYPAACRPQAWSAASALVLLRGLLGLEVDAPAGRVRAHPLAAAAGLRVSGLVLAGRRADVAVAADGSAIVTYPG